MIDLPNNTIVHGWVYYIDGVKYRVKVRSYEHEGDPKFRGGKDCIYCGMVIPTKLPCLLPNIQLERVK